MIRTRADFCETNGRAVSLRKSTNLFTIDFENSKTGRTISTTYHKSTIIFNSYKKWSGRAKNSSP